MSAGSSVAGSITYTGTLTWRNAASQTRPGIAEIATDAEVQAGTDTARIVTPAGLRADVPAVPAASRGVRLDASGHLNMPSGGHVKCAGTGDLFGMGDDFGLFNREANKGYTSIDDHFDDATIPAWGSWAAYLSGAPSGASTENLESNSAWHVNVGDDDTGAKCFYYQAVTAAAAGQALARVMVEYDSTVGIRMDDGTDNNYVEVYVTHNSAYYINVVTRYRTGGGAVTTTTVITAIEKPIYRLLSLRATGTAWTNWSARLDFGVDALVYIATIVSGLAWTPTGVGLFFSKGTNGTERGAFVDWWRVTGFA
jgi:hypothetical protein